MEGPVFPGNSSFVQELFQAQYRYAAPPQRDPSRDKGKVAPCA